MRIKHTIFSKIEFYDNKSMNKNNLLAYTLVYGYAIVFKFLRFLNIYLI